MGVILLLHIAVVIFCLLFYRKVQINLYILRKALYNKVVDT